MNTSFLFAVITWSGISLLLSIVLHIVLYKTKMDVKAGIGMLLNIVSIVGLDYYSNF